MDEVFNYQESVIDSIKQENVKYEGFEETHQLDKMITNAKLYHEKLVNIKKSMLIIKDKTSRLKKKAAKMLEDKNREDIERQRSREKRDMLEKHLEPVVNTNSNN